MDTPEGDLLPEPELEPTGWPIHQRLFGAAVRAGFGLLGALPLALFVLSEEFHRWDWDWLLGLFMGGLCGFLLLVTERRGGRWWATSLRLAVAAVLIMVVAPIATVWLENLGDPAEAFDEMAGLLRRRMGRYLIAMVFLGLGLPAVGLWFYVRNRTARLGPQLLAGMLTLLLIVLASLCKSPRRELGWAAFLFMASVQIPAAVWLGDLVARRVDPHAPQPEPGRDVRPVFAVAGAFVWLGLSTLVGPALIRSSDYRRAGEREVIQSLQAIARAQSEYRGYQPSPERYAGNLTELLKGIHRPGPRIGVRKGYVYRLIRGKQAGLHWAAAADPLTPGRSHYAINHEGKVMRSEEPVALDPETCALDDPALEQVW